MAAVQWDVVSRQGGEEVYRKRVTFLLDYESGDLVNVDPVTIPIHHAGLIRLEVREPTTQFVFIRRAIDPDRFFTPLYPGNSFTIASGRWTLHPPAADAVDGMIEAVR